MLKVPACKVSNLQNRSSLGSLINTVVSSSYFNGQGEKMSKRLGGIIGCKDKTSSWHLIGFLDGSNIGSTVHHVGEKPTVILYTYINRHAGTTSKPKPKETMSLDRAKHFSIGVGADGCQHYYITILSAIKQITHRQGRRQCLLSDNYQANLTAIY